MMINDLIRSIDANYDDNDDLDDDWWPANYDDNNDDHDDDWWPD